MLQGDEQTITQPSVAAPFPRLACGLRKSQTFASGRRRSTTMPERVHSFFMNSVLGTSLLLHPHIRNGHIGRLHAVLLYASCLVDGPTTVKLSHADTDWL